MSNPTSKSEAKPEDVLRWTEGRALVATGSPFDPVHLNGKAHVIGQGNNVFIFPGIGLGAMVAEAWEVTIGMFSAAARRLAETVRTSELESGSLFPTADRIREVTASVAEAVVKEAVIAGVAKRSFNEKDIPAAVAQAMWTPAYLKEIPAPAETVVPSATADLFE